MLMDQSTDLFDSLLCCVWALVRAREGIYVYVCVTTISLKQTEIAFILTVLQSKGVENKENVAIEG